MLTLCTDFFFIIFTFWRLYYFKIMLNLILQYFLKSPHVLRVKNWIHCDLCDLCKLSTKIEIIKTSSSSQKFPSNPLVIPSSNPVPYKSPLPSLYISLHSLEFYINQSYGVNGYLVASQKTYILSPGTRGYCFIWITHWTIWMDPKAKVENPPRRYAHPRKQRRNV